jgi:Uncharacterized conserved protein
VIEDDPIELVERPRAEWRRLYERERARLEDTLDAFDLRDRVCRIEHVGSTAVAGLAAKDIVDLDVVVDDAAVEPVATAVESHLGGTRHVNTETWQPVFRRVEGERFNDHVFGQSDPGWRTSVATVAALRDDPQLRDRYERVKRREAAETEDLGEYSAGKTPVIDDALDHAAAMGLAIDVPTDG